MSSLWRVGAMALALAATPAAADFWTAAAAPGLGAARPGRMATAAEGAVRLGHGAGAPRLLAAVLRAHGAAIQRAADAAGVAPPLLLALVAVESGGDARAVSPKGAQGLGQLMPATAARFGVADPFDPAQNLRGAAAYLDALLRRYGGDAVLALAAYNAGEGAVARHRGVPPFPETRAYVPRVLAHWRAATALCARRPTLPRHPCLMRRP